jgi:hypothetical protein
MTMLRLITTIAGLVLFAGGAAWAQSGSSGGATPSSPPAASTDQRGGATAPVGHRQPRRDSAGDSTDPFARDPADVALDRKIRSICRGC